MIIQPRSTTQQPAPRQPETPPQNDNKPAIMDGFSPRQTMAAATTYTAVLGATLGLALTRNPENLFRNVLGGAIGGTILGPAAGAANLQARGYDAEKLAGSTVTGAIMGAGVGTAASLALSLVLPESGLLQATAVVLGVAGGVAGAALSTSNEG